MRSAEPPAPRSIRVVHLMRASTALAFSMEGLAETIRGRLPDFEFVVHHNYFHRPNPVGILVDGLRASLLRGDVLHITGDCSYLALFTPGRRTVVTIHDCGTLKRTTGIRRWLYRLLWMTLPLRKVGTVVAISDAVKQELVELASVSADKIVVIHNAISPAFVEAPRLDPDVTPSRPVLLQVGTTTNKNIERLAEALHGVDCHLEVIGRLHPSQSAALRRFRVSHSMRERLPSEDVVRAYQSCDAVVFTSTNEGFGLPVLEAQACGKAVIASRIPAVIEVAGDSACLVDPLDVQSIAAGILRVLGDPNYRRGLEERGRANVKRFGLDRFLSAHAGLYRTIAVPPPRPRGASSGPRLLARRAPSLRPPVRPDAQVQERGGRRPFLRSGALIGCLSLAMMLAAPMAGYPQVLLIAWCSCALLALLPVFRVGLVDPATTLREPIITLAVAFLVYFVLGASLVVFLQGKDRVQQLVDFTGATPYSILRAALAQGIGFGLAVVSYEFFRLPRRTRAARALARRVVAVPRGQTARVFMAVGAVAQSVIFGCWLAGISLPFAHLLAFLGNLMYAGLMLAAWEASALPRSALSASALLLCLAQMSVGLIQLSKQTMLKPLLAILVGQHLRTRSITSALALVVTVTAVFALFAARVGDARNLVDLEGTDLVERAEALASGSTVASDDADPADAFIRLHYAGTQAAIMDLYDAGERGGDLKLIPWLVVPRFVAPQKPSMTRGGQEIYALLSGNEGSSDSPGIFTDGYFQLGWAGLVLSALAYGFVLAQFAAVADQMLRRDSWLLASIVLVGHFIALRIDGHVVPDVLASGVFLYAALSLLAGASFMVSPATIARRSAMPGNSRPSPAASSRR